MLILVFSSYYAKATHIIGGDLKYTCKGNNVYTLEFTLYQDCTNPALTGEPIRQDNPLQWAIYEGNGVVDPRSLVFHTSGSIQYSDFGIVPIEFSNDCINNIPNVCMRYTKFVTNVTLPPSDKGYTILYQRCCRNQSVINLINPGNIGTTLYNFIPPFSTGECTNNSAYFAKVPPQIICVNNAFSYDFSAIDPDGDSLVYYLCAAYPGASSSNPIPRRDTIVMPTNPVSYQAPLSATNPISAFPPFQVNPVTGLVTGTPTAIGRYVLTVCVDEYRNGVKINTISRDVQFTITDCSKAVEAIIPDRPGFKDIIEIQCKDYTVEFKNLSTGAMSYQWDFGDGNRSNLFSPNHRYSDTGTYTVKLIINAGTTCADSVEKKVLVYPYFYVEPDWEGVLCPGEDITLKSNLVNTLNVNYNLSWYIENELINNNNDEIKHVFQGSGGDKDIMVVATNDFGCVDTGRLTVPIDTIAVNAGRDTIIVLGYKYNLDATGGDTFQWLNPQYVEDVNDPKTATKFTDVGIYQLVLKSSTKNGCIGYDTVMIQVVASPQVYLPNAFTPNDDGLNDEFKPNTVGYSRIKSFEVYNRYGQLVYKNSNSNNRGWDGTFNGKPCDVGVYYYRVIAISPESDKEYEVKGDVTLLR